MLFGPTSSGRKILLDKGIAADKAERMAAVRIFTVPSGAYGTNLASVIPKSNTWDRRARWQMSIS